MPSSVFSLENNLLLSGLPASERQQLTSACEEVNLVLGKVLCEPGKIMTHVYFPRQSFISLTMPLDGGQGLQVGMIGNEGMFGNPLVLGVQTAPYYSVVQGAGSALCIETSVFMQLLALSDVLQHRLKLYIYVLMRQLAQAAACNRFHLVEQRLARWLLMTRDRAHSEEFHITQELLARMLGVRRVGVTKAARSLQQQSLISYSRGQMKLHDILGLEHAACSCYRADMQVYDAVLNAESAPH